MILEMTLETLEGDEGFVSHVYKDSEGYWTIGHGILIDERRGGGITEKESLNIVRGRLFDLHQDIIGAWPWTGFLSYSRQSVLLQMAYNLGIKGLGGFKKMLFAMEYGDYSLAADEALDSKWAKQVGSRADRIANLIRQG